MDDLLGKMDAETESYFKSQGGEAPLSDLKDERAAPEADEPAPDVGEDDAQLDTGEVPNDDEPAAEEKPNQRRLVPHSALHEAREELKREKAERARFEETVNQRLALIAGNQQKPPQALQPQQPEFKMPNPQEDPVGTLETLLQAVNVMAEREVGRDQQTRQAAEFNHFVDWYKQDAAAVAAEVPDFKDAYSHLSGMREKQLEAQALALGRPVNKEAIKNTVRREEYEFTRAVAQRGQSPSRAIYNLALQSGWSPQQAQQLQAPQAETRLANIARGQAENRSLGSSPGSASAGPMTAEKLGNMSPDEFEAYFAKNPKTAQRLMGG